MTLVGAALHLVFELGMMTWDHSNERGAMSHTAQWGELPSIHLLLISSFHEQDHSGFKCQLQKPSANYCDSSPLHWTSIFSEIMKL